MWPFVFQGAYYLSYFRLALFAPQKPISDFRGGWREQMQYYVSGAGGETLLGGHLLLLLALLVLGSAFLWRRGDGQGVARLRDQLAPLAIAYTIPTLTPVKQPFFAVTFSFLLVLLGVEVMAAVLRGMQRDGSRRGAIASLAAVVLTGIACARGPTYWGALNDPRIGPNKDLAAAIAASVRDLNLRPDSMLFVTATGGVNQDLLRYMLLKDGVTGVRVHTIAFEENTGVLAPYGKWFNRADAVLASEAHNDDVYTSLPNGYIQGQVLDLLRRRPDYVMRQTFPTPGGRGSYLLFEKAGAFFGWTPVAGFLPEEGPYPDWSLPRVRWGTGPSSVLSLKDVRGAPQRLIVLARPYANGMTMTIHVDGVEIGRHTFPDAEGFGRVEVPLGTRAAGQRVELRYDTWDKSDAQSRALLFRKLKVIPEAMSDQR
jgi:hypothetical protein